MHDMPYLARKHGLLNKAGTLQQHHITGGLATQHYHNVAWHQLVR